MNSVAKASLLLWVGTVVVGCMGQQGLVKAPEPVVVTDVKVKVVDTFCQDTKLITRGKGDVLEIETARQILEFDKYWMVRCGSKK